MSNTIADNLQRLVNAKDAIATAITNQGGTVSQGDGLEDFATAIGTIEPDLTTKQITVNGTYQASDDSADGYSEVTVNVPSGGGGAARGDVNFYDYDGTIVNSYSAAEFAQLSVMALLLRAGTGLFLTQKLMLHLTGNLILVRCMSLLMVRQDSISHLQRAEHHPF